MAKKPMQSQKPTESTGKKRKEKGETQKTPMQRVKVYRNNRPVMEWRPW